MATGDNILASDYNNIRDKVGLVLGAGSGSYGYGQTLQSAAEAVGYTVDAAGWNNLRYDLINIKLHQDGVQPAVVSPSSGAIVYYGSSHPNNSYNTLIDAATATRFNIAASRSVITAKLNRTTTAAWANLAYCTATITFSSADQARYFFNAGGKLRIASSLTGSATPQSVAWANLLTSAGTRELSATATTAKTVYQLTSSNQLLYSITDSGAYSTNVYRIYARCNVADNSAGTATVYYIYVEWDDNHTNPYYDSVTGTLGLTVDELKASGSMLPSGTFTITSPTYSISTITAS